MPQRRDITAFATSADLKPALLANGYGSEAQAIALISALNGQVQQSNRTGRAAKKRK